MHALEWIAEHGRFLRSMEARPLRSALGRTSGQCTWCGGQVTAPRRLWCSEACVEAWRLRCSPGHIRRAVQRRDGGVCAVCKRKNYTEADHIIPVVEGGGLCDLSGYRSLCRACHQDATAGLAARRGRRRPPPAGRGLFDQETLCG
jgi:hypothetical protein